MNIGSNDKNQNKKVDINGQIKAEALEASKDEFRTTLLVLGIVSVLIFCFCS